MEESGEVLLALIVWVVVIFCVLQAILRPTPRVTESKRYSDKTIVLVATLLFLSVVGILVLVVIFLRNRKKALAKADEVKVIDSQQE